SPSTSDPDHCARNRYGMRVKPLFEMLSTGADERNVSGGRLRSLLSVGSLRQAVPATRTRPIKATKTPALQRMQRPPSKLSLCPVWGDHSKGSFRVSSRCWARKAWPLRFLQLLGGQGSGPERSDEPAGRLR